MTYFGLYESSTAALYAHNSDTQYDCGRMYETIYLFSNMCILIKITQCHYGVRTFLQNGSTDFDKILHVAWEWLPEGYGISGRSGYSPV